MSRALTLPALCLIGATINACNSHQQAAEADISQLPWHEQVVYILQNNDEVIAPRPDIHPVTAVFNRENIIPPMCYTQTEGQHNPCYVCHQDAIADRENVMNDGNLQAAYSFSDMGLTNRWENLFIDRSRRVAQISDEDILEWVAQDNYSDLPGRLEAINFKGWIPDLADLQEGPAAFDEQGFALDGSHWVAFNYKPFPSTFWPTNGSTDDVMIQLPEQYRSDEHGDYSREIYKANLAILEANIKGVDRIGSLPIDERAIGQDLNGDGAIGTIYEVTKVDSWVGAASGYFLDTFLYPKGTSFLHTVRYLQVDDEGEVSISRRMKEVRYMKKWKAYPKGSLARVYEEEAFEKEAGHLPGYTNLGDHGFDNDSGWSVQGFIESSDGRLRVSSFEENMFCMGCHSSIGSTIDKTFSFARKIDGAGGWGYIDLKGMVDAPTAGEEQGEILTYFQRAGGGDEFRSNTEMQQRWFHEDGTVNIEAVEGQDVYTLITPSRERALALNKAYKTIVEDQRFIYGRDATVTPPVNVYNEVDNETSPTLMPEHIFSYDLRLDWGKVSQEVGSR